jgi:hypothetical protein
MGQQVGNDSGTYENETMSVGKIVAKVAGISNGLDTNDAHLKVDKIHTIFKIYDELTNLMRSYGEMAAHDLQEFQQVGVNIKNTDKEAS